LSNFRGRKQEGSSHKMCSANLIRKLWTCLGAPRNLRSLHIFVGSSWQDWFSVDASQCPVKQPGLEYWGLEGARSFSL
jgi:hypothetical protein